MLNLRCALISGEFFLFVYIWYLLVCVNNKKSYFFTCIVMDAFDDTFSLVLNFIVILTTSLKIYFHQTWFSVDLALLIISSLVTISQVMLNFFVYHPIILCNWFFYWFVDDASTQLPSPYEEKWHRPNLSCWRKLSPLAKIYRPSSQFVTFWCYSNHYYSFARVFRLESKCSYYCVPPVPKSTNNWSSYCHKFISHLFYVIMYVNVRWRNEK